MTEWAAPFEYLFMQRAFVGGVAIAVTAALLGTFVVQRGLSFLGDGLAHASFGGIALGAWVAFLTGSSGWLAEPLLVALPFTVAAALAIAWVRSTTSLSSDTAIGVFFAVSVALGVLFLSRIPPDANVVDVWHLLFGSILAVGRSDVRVIVLTAAVVSTFVLTAWPRLAYATFDVSLARADGVHVGRLDVALFVAAAVTVVVSAQVVGVVLMAAYLVIPAAAARLTSATLSGMTVRAVTIGVATTVVGLYLSFVWDVPSGSAIVLSQAAVFLASWPFARR